MVSSYFFFIDTATTEIYTLSLHDALPIFDQSTVQLAGATRSVVLFPLQRAKNRAEQIWRNQFVPMLPFAAQPDEHLACGRMFANAPLQHFPKLSMLSAFTQDAGNLRDHAAMTQLH